MRTILKGTETDTLELGGTLPASARSIVPAPLEVPDGPLHVDVLFFAMRGLALRGMPWPTFDYQEALWRVAVRIDGEPGWFAVACDLDSPTIRAFGRRVVRYPVRVARFDQRWSVDTAVGALSTRVIEEEPSRRLRSLRAAPSCAMACTCTRSRGRSSRHRSVTRLASTWSPTRCRSGPSARP